MAEVHRSLRIVLAASEAVPFSKTGGLADVVCALAKALDQAGHDVTLIIPDYYVLRKGNKNLPVVTETGMQVSVPLGDRSVEAAINWTTIPGTGVRVFLVRQTDYFDRKHLYQENGDSYPDNCERFCFFSRAVLEICRLMVLRPDVIHCNDWQTGLIPALLNTQYANLPGFEHTATVMTLHNMAYQGQFWHFDMPLTGMDWKYFNLQQMEAWGYLNLLKTGIAFADQITTVSPTYAKEICTIDGGYGLDGLLRYRQKDLVGILNGIDTEVWNPARDIYLPARYSRESVDAGKPQCKAALQKRMRLPVRPDVPLLGMVSRMADQKGFDLVMGTAEHLLTQDIQMVFLGTGDPGCEAQLRELASRYPMKVAAEIGFDESLAHQIEAGADIFLMPSRFEPCGLNQMYSLNYGTVPIVRNVGGLADSVINLEQDGEEINVSADLRTAATGFVFDEYSLDAFASIVMKALQTYSIKPVWNRLIHNGMSTDWSWNSSALKYLDVYARAKSRIGSRAAERRQ